MKRFSILTTLFVFLLAVSSTFAAIPMLIPYQANVIDAQKGEPLDGVYSVTFELFDSPNGGTPIWTVNRSVAIDKGYINVMLGEVNPLNGVDFSKQLYLQVTVGNGTPYPRTKLGSTPYAFKALNAITADTAQWAMNVVEKALDWTRFQDAALKAGGDLMGNYPNPTLRDGVVLENIKPGSITQKYLAPNVTVPPSGKAGGDLSGVYPDPIIAKGAVKTDRIADGAVTLEKMAYNSVNSANIIDGSVMLADLNAEVKNLGGDLTGTLPNPTVVGLQKVGVSATAPTSGQALIYHNGMWMGMNAAGDVAGPFDNLQIQPGTVGSLELLDGSIVDADVNAMAAIKGTKISPDFGMQDIKTTGDLYADNAFFAFDVYGDDFFGTAFHGTNADFKNLTVNTTTNLSGVTTITGPLHLNGAIDGNNNVMLDGEQLPASSDLDGYYPAPKIRDLAVTVNKIATGAVTGDKILDGTITDADVAGNAAIKGTKILPDFGNQTIRTTGSFDVGGNITNSGGVNVTVDDNLIVTGDLKVNGTINLTNVNAVNVTATNGVFTNLTVTNPIVGSMSKTLKDGIGIGTFTYNGGADAVVNVNVDGATIGVDGYDALYLMDNAVSANKIQTGAVTSAKILDGTIADVDIAANAAIQGTKILPDFGNQTIKTTGSFDVGGNITNSTGYQVTVDDNLVVTGDLTVGGLLDIQNLNAVNVTATNGTFTNLTVTNPINGSMIGTLKDGNGIASFTYNGGADAVVDVNIDGTTIGLAADALYLMDNAVTNAKIADNAVTLNEMADNSVGADELIATAVVAGTYGTQTAVGQFSVDADGRLTFANNVNILVNDDAVTSDIDITGATSDLLNLQVRPNTIGSNEIIDGSINYTDLNGSGGAKGQQLTSDGSGNVYWADAMALPYEGALATGEDAFKISQNHATMGTAAIFNSTIAQNMDNAVEITKDVANGAGSALSVYGIGVLGQNYIAKFENQNGAEGRTAYFKSTSPAGASGMWNVNNGFDGIYNTPDDFVNLDPIDNIEATVVVSNAGPNQSNQQLAIKTYGSIQANSAVIATNLVGVKMLTLGVGGTNGYGEILAPVAVSGQAGTPQMYVNPGFYIDGSVDITGQTHGVGAADFDNTMNVDGNTTLNEDVDLGDASDDMITFFGMVDSNILPATDFAYDLGNATYRWDDVYMQNLWAVNGYFTGNLDVDGNTRLGDQISDAVVLNGTITSALGPVYVNDLLNVTGNVDFDANFNLDGTAATAGANPFTVADDFNVDFNTDLDGNLLVNGTSQFNMFADFDANVNVDGTVATAGANPFTVADDFNVDFNTDLDGNLLVNGTSQFNMFADFDANVNVDGYVATAGANPFQVNDNLLVTGTSDLQGSISNTSGNNGGAVHVNDLFYVNGNSTFNGTMSQLGAANQVTFAGNVDATNGLDVTGANLTVTGGTIDGIFGNVAGFTNPSAGNDVYVQGNLEVDGAAYLASLFVDAYTTGSALFIGPGSQVLQDNANFFWNDAANQLGIGTNVTSATLDVVGSTELNGTLTQTGAANQVTFAGNVDATNGLDVTGANFTVDAVFSITQAGVITQTANQQVTFAGNVNANNGVDVLGADLTVGGGLFTVNVTNGNTHIGGTLDVDGNSNFDGNLATAGAGPLVVADNFNVTGTSDFDGNANFDGTLATAGAGPLVVADNFNVTGNGDIDGNLLVNGNGDVDGTFNADGATTLNANVTLGDAGADYINFLGTTSTILPQLPDGSKDLGSAVNSWRDIFYDGTLVGGDGHFQNLRVDINTDLRGPIYNTTQNTFATPLQFADDVMPTINSTFDFGSPAMHFRNINSDALNTWGPGGITVNNAGGIGIVGSGGLSIANGGATITGGATVTGLLTANNDINVHGNINNSTGNVVVNDVFELKGDFRQTVDGTNGGKMFLGYDVAGSLAALNASKATVINYTGPAGMVDATIDLPLPSNNGQIIYIVNGSGAAITVWNCTGTTTSVTINPNDMGAFIYVGGWRILQ